MRRRIGYLPQEPRFYPHLIARETLRFAAGFFFSGPPARIEGRIEAAHRAVAVPAVPPGTVDLKREQMRHHGHGDHGPD